VNHCFRDFVEESCKDNMRTIFFVCRTVSRVIFTNNETVSTDQYGRAC
jgi:hypothetical protein